MPIVALTIIAFVAFSLVGGGISDSIEKNLAEFKEAIEVESEGTFEYGEVKTGLLKQNMIVNDLVFTFSDEAAPETLIQLKVGSMEVKNKDYKVNIDGMIEKLLVTFKDFSFIQEINMGEEELTALEMAGMEWMSGLTNSGMKADKITVDFTGALPEEFELEGDEESVREALLAFFSHDQEVKMKAEGIQITEEISTHPLYSLITEEQKKEVFFLDEMESFMSFSRSNKRLEVEIPEIKQKYGFSSMDGFIEIDSDQMLESQDFTDLAIGKFKLEGDCNYSGMSDIKFGDGKEMGVHSVDGLVYHVNIEGDLKMIDIDTLANGGSSEVIADTFLNSIKFNYLYDISDVKLSFNTHPEEEFQLGEYSLDKLKVSLGVDLSKAELEMLMISPVSMISAVHGEVQIKELSASLPNSFAEIAVAEMGIPEEIVKKPEVSSFVIDISSDNNGMLDLSKNEFVSNLGTIKTNGKLSLLGMLTPALPPEAQGLLNPGKTGKQTIKISGNALEGFSYSN